MTVPIHFASMILCVGLAIVLAALGSRAAGTWKSYTVAGAIAGAIILYGVQYETLPTVIPAARGELRGTNLFAEVTMWGSGPMFVARRKEKGDFEFAVFTNDLDHTNVVSLNVTKNDGTEFTINCIATDIIRSHFGQLTSFGLALRSSKPEGPWFVYDFKEFAVWQI